MDHPASCSAATLQRHGGSQLLALPSRPHSERAERPQGSAAGALQVQGRRSRGTLRDRGQRVHVAIQARRHQGDHVLVLPGLQQPPCRLRGVQQGRSSEGVPVPLVLERYRRGGLPGKS
ncbi:unnamed protein product [Linum tenue]|uniref:Uncharacterized protein n=1 Tax=Linum tenue TaxID=586396 RepID=A0AAV0LPU3_9ROSI|nr:unnamed protein product [Linum tenue]